MRHTCRRSRRDAHKGAQGEPDIQEIKVRHTKTIAQGEPDIQEIKVHNNRSSRVGSSCETTYDYPTSFNLFE